MQYELAGGAYPVVVCHLESGEKMKAEKPCMVWLDPTLTIENSSRSMRKAFSKIFSGETYLQSVYTATEPGMIAFGSTFPGRILPVRINPGQGFIVQKMSLLASEMDVELSLFFEKKMGGFFGSDPFTMQRLSGSGLVFLECQGELVKYDLTAGHTLVASAGCVLGFTEGMTVEVDRVKGAKSMRFGADLPFNLRITGPGTLWLQTMPVSNLADVLVAHPDIAG